MFPSKVSRSLFEGPSRQSNSNSTSDGPQYAIIRVPDSSRHGALRLYDLLVMGLGV